ncbi:MAG: 3-hydroxyacyl-CoA dehydrogenase family protein [Magnetococcales bacterium]|nr:3-hydroxyacyl-CoA dehydrogenase family protein [Magnetococcales bacterium]
MMREEAASVSRLIVGDISKQLVRIFFLSERLKAFGKRTNSEPKRVHVVGAGVMGGDIAAWCALRGLTVTLQDMAPDRLAPALKRARQLYQKKLRHPRLIQEAMDRLRPDIAGDGVAKADVVIEAIAENLKAKQGLFQALEPHLKSGALLASNTSSLPLEKLGEGLAHPEQLIGLHFFNPVAKMPLLEVVSSATTDPESAAKGFAFAQAIGRLPLPVKSAPGFLVNRLLMPYMLEAVQLASEGVSFAHIDTVAKSFGMPMGPLALADTVGLDICLSVAEVLAEHLEHPVPITLREMVELGQLGRKTGEGFYHHDKKKVGAPTRRQSLEPPEEEVRDRLILPLLNEAVACLRQEVVKDADLLDAGVVFGTGFAPFRGGPMGYLASQGIETIINRLKELEAKHGARFKPDPGWQHPAFRSQLQELARRER